MCLSPVWDAKRTRTIVLQCYIALLIVINFLASIGCFNLTTKTDGEHTPMLVYQNVLKLYLLYKCVRYNTSLLFGHTILHAILLVLQIDHVKSNYRLTRLID